MDLCAAQDLATTNGLLASLTATSGGGGSGAAGGGAAAGGGDAGAAALVQGLLDRVPADFNLEAVQAAYPVSYHQSLNQVRKRPVRHTHATSCHGSSDMMA